MGGGSVCTPGLSLLGVRVHLWAQAVPPEHAAYREVTSPAAQPRFKQEAGAAKWTVRFQPDAQQEARAAAWGRGSFRSFVLQ